jgi:LmbE family N-acetylglucosaminyl deacetylase
MLSKRLNKHLAIGVLLRLAIGVLLLTLVLLYLFSPYVSENATALTKNHLKQNTNIIGNRVLVVAPHPDDEVLGGGGVIEHAISSGKQVKVVIMTNGDGFAVDAMRHFKTLSLSAPAYQKLGYIRHQETIRALQHLGVKPSDIFFLSYPDGGLQSLWESNWSCNQLYRGLNGWTHAAYPFSYQTNAPYCGESVVANLSKIIGAFQPTTIVFPDPHDEHPDHWATNAFVQFALANMHYHAEKWTYLVHYGGFLGSWRNNSLISAIPPNTLNKLGIKWIYVPLNKQEQQRKLESLNNYMTQTEIMSPWMKQFVRENDLLEVYPDVVWHINKKDTHARWSFAETAGESYLQNWIPIPDSDIVSVDGMVKDNRLYIGCNMKSYSKQPVTFRFHLRNFYRHGNRRMVFTVQPDRLQQQQNDVTVLSEGSQIWLALPTNILNHVDGFLISIETLSGKKQIGRTAWRYVQVTD